MSIAPSSYVTLGLRCPHCGRGPAPGERPAPVFARPQPATGEICNLCGGMMQRTGSCLTCSSCGESTGCG